jgi:molybdopterin adenylyltransferase
MSNRAVIITVSDRCCQGETTDRSGPTLMELLPSLGARLVHHEIVPDDAARIRSTVAAWLSRAEIVLTTGGTGIGARDVTPEAIGPLIETLLPGFGEIMRVRTFDQTPLSIVSRTGAGIARGTLIVWLPGSPEAVRECLAWIAPAIRHVCEFLRGRSPHGLGEARCPEPPGPEDHPGARGDCADRCGGSDRGG